MTARQPVSVLPMADPVYPCALSAMQCKASNATHVCVSPATS